MKPGDLVAWKWGNGIAEGSIDGVFYERIEITSKGKKIVRNGSKNNPALLINHNSGNQVLKLVSEVQLTNK